MKFQVKPYVTIEGKGTKKEAMTRLYDHYGLSKYANCFSSAMGSVQQRPFSNGDAWVYTIQVFKRGKWRKDKHYVLRIYRIPESVLRYFRVKLHQKTNGVKIEKY